MACQQDRFIFILKARAAFLLLLSIHLFLIYPATAAGPSPSNTNDQGQLRAAPPLRLVPPPPATAPSPNQVPPPPPSPAFDTNAQPASEYDIQHKAIPGVDYSYILGPGDIISAYDYSSSDTAQPITIVNGPILPDGTIDIHPIGVIKAAGVSLQELIDIVNRKAEQFIIKPDIEISVQKVRPNMVYLLGEVVKPGLYTNESSSISGAESPVSQSAYLTIVSALQKAGGVKESADVRSIRITRLGAKEPLRVNLWQMLVEGDATQDITLMSGDVVYVAKGGADYDADSLGLAANQRRTVRIWGAVAQPGLIEMRPDDDILSLISRAGGFIKTATKSTVVLSRMNRDGTVTTRKISITRAIRDPDTIGRAHVKPGDLVIVNDSKLKRTGYVFGNYGVYFIYAVLLIFAGQVINQMFLNNNNNNNNGGGVNTAIPILAPANAGS